MALTAKLARFNPSTVNGINASLEDETATFGDRITLVQTLSPDISVGEVCRLAARKLRKMAKDFEQLAREEKPFHEATHIRVRRKK